MKKTEFVRFDPRQDGHLIDKLIHCYRLVFGERPWSEWKKCSICGKKWGLEDLNELHAVHNLHCGREVEDFWPEVTVREDLFFEIKPESSCWLATQEKQSTVDVVGFCWGYPILAEQLEIKLVLPGIAEKLKDRFGVDRFAYLDEIGLIKDMREKQIAKKLNDKVISDILAQGVSFFTVRTKTNPPTVAYHWLVKYGYEVVAHYNDSDGRVILAKELR